MTAPLPVNRKAGKVIPFPAKKHSKNHVEFLPTDTRDQRIEKGKKIVDAIAGTLALKTFIERGDVVSVGVIQAITTIDRGPANDLPLDKAIARDCKTVMLRFIKRAKKHYRYSQRGSEKAIRDTDTGNQSGDVDGGQWDDPEITEGVTGDPNPDIADVAPAKIAPSVRNHDFPNIDGFIYKAWLRGSVSVRREYRGTLTPWFCSVCLTQHPASTNHEWTQGYSFKKLDPLEFCIRPVLGCMSQWTPYQFVLWRAGHLVRDHGLTGEDPHAAYIWEASFKKPKTRWVISPASGVKEIRGREREGTRGHARAVKAWGETIGPVRCGSGAWDASPKFDAKTGKRIGPSPLELRHAIWEKHREKFWEPIREAPALTERMLRLRLSFHVY